MLNATNSEQLISDAEIIDAFGENTNYPGRFARSVLDLVLSRQKAALKAQSDDAAAYHVLMGLLHNTKMAHGLCEPRSRQACTRCNAQDKIDHLVAEYKGAPIEPQRAAFVF